MQMNLQWLNYVYEMYPDLFIKSMTIFVKKAQQYKP